MTIYFKYIQLYALFLFQVFDVQKIAEQKNYSNVLIMLFKKEIISLCLVFNGQYIYIYMYFFIFQFGLLQVQKYIYSIFLRSQSFGQYQLFWSGVQTLFSQFWGGGDYSCRYLYQNNFFWYLLMQPITDDKFLHKHIQHDLYMTLRSNYQSCVFQVCIFFMHQSLLIQNQYFKKDIFYFGGKVVVRGVLTNQGCLIVEKFRKRLGLQARCSFQPKLSKVYQQSLLRATIVLFCFLTRLLEVYVDLMCDRCGRICTNIEVCCRYLRIFSLSFDF
eukprot:TRINITY_DN845_c0_g1_i1.p1 TRINITY_DN845_c0_g1~~TRINITY_DN845_c0_g1_i1.p1  ORF type:complete len:273 (-),score=-9.93 TRINITY_DN845_c0_g1_i1:250-1068(-)